MLLPERLHLAKLGTGCLRLVQQFFSLALLSSDQSFRVNTLIDLFGHDSLAGGKIIERAKRVLHFLQRYESRLSPLRMFPSGKETRKKLDNVAQVFRPHAEVMPLLRANCSMLCDLALTQFL
jgi:hypothetical protein